MIKNAVEWTVSARLLASAGLLSGVVVFASPAAGQEVALVHEAGDRIRVAGMPVREFASGLRMESLGGAEGAFPDVCFVALVDSHGNVWEEYVSEPFQSGDGELDGACIPRFPLLASGRFPEVALRVPFEAGYGSDIFLGGAVDWEMAVRTAYELAPELETMWPAKWYREEAPLQPPPHLEGMEYDWVALLFLAGPSEDPVGMNVGLQFSSRPIMILVGGN